eukprot:GILJ01004029.1.p1 GENE.GILJ01004029.1~~GILJ01004029.1.p1  ORF type:complete len:266 (-),score=32.64 GILJ01004029.1:218-1015(-)
MVPFFFILSVCLLYISLPCVVLDGTGGSYFLFLEREGLLEKQISLRYGIFRDGIIPHKYCLFNASETNEELPAEAYDDAGESFSLSVNTTAQENFVTDLSCHIQESFSSLLAELRPLRVNLYSGSVSPLSGDMRVEWPDAYCTLEWDDKLYPKGITITVEAVPDEDDDSNFDAVSCSIFAATDYEPPAVGSVFTQRVVLHFENSYTLSVSRKGIWILLILLLLGVAGALAAWLVYRYKEPLMAVANSIRHRSNSKHVRIGEDDGL